MSAAPTLNQIQQVNLAASRCVGTAINWDEYFGEAGKEHYKLLHWLAGQFSDAGIFDIGTHRGASALALASGSKKNQIFSFDLEHKYPLAQVSTITYGTDNLMTPEGREQWRKKLLAAPFIFLDIDPHEGTRELEFIGWLREQRYKGFVICDDIWYFKPMRDNFWYKVPGAEKVDVTALGHWSGTGIIRFPEWASQETLDLWPAAASPQPGNWTVVTGYFDLTAMPDASMSIKARPAGHYLANARATMAVEQNLVVYCEPEHVEELRAMRPAWLLENHTKFVPMSFEDFPLTQWRSKIIENRKTHPYQFDDRNTASYYLLCMARYAMLQKAMAENTFGSTHFAWLNICIERMGWRNVAALESVWPVNRDRFSTCWIDYQPEQLARNTTEYFRWGRCGMCSGFFTGRKEFMEQFCSAITEQFLRVLEEGYGHADEQLFSLVYFDKPEIFEHYYGDYQEMITNYVAPVDRTFEPVRLVGAHALAHGNLSVAVKALEAVWFAWKRGAALLDGGQLAELVRLLRQCNSRMGLGATVA
jgi:hypothetical protein